MRRDIEWRYHGIKTDLRKLFDGRLSGYNTTQNSSETSAIICNNDDGPPSLFWVNAGEYEYTIDGAAMAGLFQQIQVILDQWLLEGGPSHIWAGNYVAEEYERGTHMAYTSLAKQSEEYAQQTILTQLLFSPEYQRRIGIAYSQVYSDWKSVSDKARGELANVLSDAVARGVNPRETAKIISQRLDVSMSGAFNIAQTEQVGAYRQAIWDENDDVQQRLGLRTKLLWLSALKSTTRAWHASRHGKTYTTDEVKAFYAKDGNKYHCYCSQVPTLIDMYGDPLNTTLSEKLAKERQEWLDAA